MLGRLATVAALLAAAASVVGGCQGDAPVAPLEPVDPLVLYPAPRYFADGPYGVRYAHPQLAYDSAPPPDLSPAAQAAWDAGGSDRYVVVARYESGHAIVRAYGETARAVAYAHDTAVALVDGSARLHLATVVDGAPFEVRGFVEGHYGAPLQPWQRRCLLSHLATMRGNLYLYGPKGDPYAHQQWADPYPPEAAAAITDAVATATARGLGFAWAVSPGLQAGYPAPGASLSFASDEDFARLTAKIDAMGALGVTRFALFLDDITPSLVWPADAAAFATPAAAHAALANRLDDYVTAAGGPHLLFVGPVYTSKFAGWEPWATEIGAALHPGIDVLWTGPAVYPDLISSGDLSQPDALLQRNVVLWNNQPTAPVALTGYSPILPTAARGILSNTIMIEKRGSFDDLWKIVGTLGDYAWNPGAYDPDRSLATWSDILATAPPCSGQ